MSAIEVEIKKAMVLNLNYILSSSNITKTLRRMIFAQAGKKGGGDILSTFISLFII